MLIRYKNSVPMFNNENMFTKLYNDFLDCLDRIDPYNNISNNANTSSDSSSLSRSVIKTESEKIIIDLPGYKKEEITISVLSDVTLLIRAENKSRGLSQLKVYIPAGTNLDKATSILKNGALEIYLPKGNSELRTIEISD